jgi:hypothetical protein
MACLYKLLAVQYGTICSSYMHADNGVYEYMTAFDREWI